MTDTPTPETGAETTTEAAPAAPAAVATVEPPVAPEPSATTEPPATPASPAPVPATAPDADAAAPKVKKTVQVPVWALVAVVAAVFVVGAFFLGRSTAPESDSGPKTLSDAVEMTASGDMEVGDFNARRLLEALSQNDQLDLGLLGDLLGGGGRN